MEKELREKSLLDRIIELDDCQMKVDNQYKMENILSDNSFHLLQIGADEGLFMYTGIRRFGYTFEFPSPKGWVGGNMKQEIGCAYLCGEPYRKVLEEMLGRRSDHWHPTPLIEEIAEKYWKEV